MSLLELTNNDGEISPGEPYEVYGNIRNKVIDQIADFLDPDKKIVYNIYKVTNLYDNNLRTIDKTNLIYLLNQKNLLNKEIFP